MIDVDEAGFERDVLQRSTEVPVVIDFWAEWCEPCKQLSPLLERLAGEYDGRFVLAKIDVDANQMLMQQFGVQGIPAVFAVVAGQALPLFQGAAPEAQIRETLDQLVQVAEQRFGITGAARRRRGRGEPARGGRRPRRRPVRTTRCSRPPYQALDAGDLGGAVQAYKNVLERRPGQHGGQARSGAGRVAAAGAGRWTRSRCARRPRRSPADVQAQIAAADLDLVGGHVEDAFGRLVDAVRRTAGDDRDAARRAAAGAVRGDRRATIRG